MSAPGRHSDLVSASIALQGQVSRAEEPALKQVQDGGKAASGWTSDAEKELLKIPFFVRGKARRNTEKYASAQGLTAITLDTLYDAKAHYAR